VTRGGGVFRWSVLCAGFVFLYAPIALLVLYSFNASRLVTVWGGFSSRWYAALLDDRQMVDAALVSLRVALVSSALATALGTCAAIALARYGAFRGRALFAAMVMAPLVMPEVIMGLSLLLLFVALDAPRGFWTIVLAHATMGMCFVTVVVRERLEGVDRAIEEAAMDLGASPAQTLLRVTLPIALPAILAGYVLAFTLSLDDFVIASFTSGPGSTTLPMRVYSQARLGVSPMINAISTIMIGLVAALLVVHALARASRRPRD
jgi:putrescine transport system permease protein